MLPFFIAQFFGATPETDAFFLAYSIILYSANVFSPVIEKIIIPFVAEAKHRREYLNELLSEIRWLYFAVSLAVSILVVVSARYLLPMALLNFSAENVDLSFRLLLITAPIFVAIVLSGIVAGVLNAFKHFSYPAISPLFRFILVILCIVLLRESMGVYSIAVGYLLGEFARYVFLMTAVKRKDLVSFIARFRITRESRQFLKVSGFQILASISFGVMTMMDRVFASWLQEGSISIYQYADRIYNIPFTVFSVGIVPIMLSHWGQEFYQNEKGNVGLLKKNIAKFISVLSAIIVGTTILSIVAIDAGATYLFDKSQIADDQVKTIGLLSIILIIGLLPAVCSSVVANGLIVLRKTRPIMVVSLIALLTKAPLTYWLMAHYEIYGIAISWVAINIVVFVCFSITLARQSAISEQS